MNVTRSEGMKTWREKMKRKSFERNEKEIKVNEMNNHTYERKKILKK